MTANRNRLTALGAVVGVLVSLGADWPGFRGPNGDGTSSETGLPVKWGPKENVAWKVKLPGPGTSSPIVSKGRVFVTCFTGHEAARKGDVEKIRRHLLCFDRKNGAVLWHKEIPAKLPENDYNTYHTQHGYSSSTPAADGERVYVFFGRTGVLAFDYDGKQLWQTEVGEGLNSWGSAASPVVYKDLVIVNATVEKASLYGLDRKTGKQVWRTRGFRDTWSTPLLVEVPGGKTELVFSTAGELLGLDPDTGVKLWNCEGVSTTTPTSSPIARKGVIYVMAAGLGGTRSVMAVRAGGRGDVTKTHVVWRQTGGTNQTSPVLVGEYLFYVSGLVHCLRADTGKTVYQERLYETQQEYDSPIAADGKIYMVTRRSGTYVLGAGGKFELLAHNDLGDRSIFNASPAVSDGQLFIRSHEYLYCIGMK